MHERYEMLGPTCGLKCAQTLDLPHETNLNKVHVGLKGAKLEKKENYELSDLIRCSVCQKRPQDFG